MPVSLILAVHPWSLYLRSSSTEVLVFGCGLIENNVRFWRFIFLNELNLISSPRPCVDERFLPCLTLCLLLTVCSLISKK